MGGWVWVATIVFPSLVACSLGLGGALCLVPGVLGCVSACLWLKIFLEGVLFVGGSLNCWRVFGCCHLFLSHVVGWVRRVLETRGSRMGRNQRLYFVATVLCCNGYFLATATFGGGVLAVLWCSFFAIRRAILTGRNLDIF